MSKTVSAGAFALSLFAMAVAVPSSGSAIELQPGMWEETETGEENGKPVEPEVTKSCMTPEEAKDPAQGLAALDQEMKKQCKTLDVKVSGSGLTMRMQCAMPGYSMDMALQYTFITAQHYTGTVKSTVILAGRPTVSNKAIVAKRIGECKS